MTSRNCFPRRGSKCSTVKVAIPMSLTPYCVYNKYQIANKRTLSEAVRYYGCVGDSKYQRNKGVCGNKGVNKVNKVSAK